MACAGFRLTVAANSTTDRGAHIALPVRFADLGARPDAASIRVPLPYRNLHAGSQAQAWLLCAALPAGRPARGTGGPESGSRQGGVAGDCDTLRAMGETRGDRGGVAGRVAPDGQV